MSENEMDATFGLDKRAHSICVLKPRVYVMYFYMQSICNALAPVMLPWLKLHIVEMMRRFLKRLSYIVYINNSRSAFPTCIPQKKSTEGTILCVWKLLQSWNNGTMAL